MSQNWALVPKYMDKRNAVSAVIALYLTVYEENLAIAGGYKRIGGRSGHLGYFTCYQDRDRIDSYFCYLPLWELEPITRKVVEVGNWDLCFRVCLDFGGKKSRDGG